MSDLNQGQQDAADFFFAMLFDDAVKEMSISGAAGTGKTFLMGHLIDNVLKRYYETCKLMGIAAKYHNVVMTASTNKAAEVLSQAIKRPTQTCHSFFNLIVQENFKTGETEIKKSKSWKIHSNTIIFIDEAYFLDYKTIQNIHEGTMNCKIVYVGDKDQMNPVKEKVSYVANPANNIPTIHLTEPMRNATKPELAALCQQFKENVTTHKFKPIITSPGSIVLLSDEEAEEHIQQNFVHQNTGSRILCFHNKRVNEFNAYIRNLRGLPYEYQEGEYLINAASIRNGSCALSVEDEILIENLGPQHEVLINDDPEFPLDVVPAELSSSFKRGHFIIPLDREYVDKLSKYFKKEKMWGHFFWLKNNLPDLRPRDACTVYKAQGSTLNTVYLDLSDIASQGIADKVARMLYVGASRAKETVYMFGKLPEKFGKII